VKGRREEKAKVRQGSGRNEAHVSETLRENEREKQNNCCTCVV